MKVVAEPTTWALVTTSPVVSSITPEPSPLPVDIWTTWGLTLATTETNVCSSSAAEPVGLGGAGRVDDDEVADVGLVVDGDVTCPLLLQPTRTAAKSPAVPIVAAKRETSLGCLTCSTVVAGGSPDQGRRSLPDRRPALPWSNRGQMCDKRPCPHHRREWIIEG